MFSFSRIHICQKSFKINYVYGNSRQYHSRRELLRQMLGFGASLPLIEPGMLPLLADSQEPHVRSAQPPSNTNLSKDDDQFLEDLERANFSFFWEQTSQQTGLVKDRCNIRGPDHTVVASIAATGFGLTALCIGHKRGFISLHQAQTRVLTALRFLWKKLAHPRGFFFHFANINTGERLAESEVSSIDTAILLCGVLTCREHFRQHPEIADLAYKIYSRVDWTWLSEDTPLLPHGWTPENGFLPYRWADYSEMMMMYFLGLGSPTHALKPAAWNAWKRTTFEYDGIRYIGSFAPLFIHQYSQAWFDFRRKKDKYADYFQNSAIATDVHRRFCIELGKIFPDYTNDLWGITASDSQKGYVVWGGPPAMGPIDGTVVPAAAGGSLPFLPDATMRVIRSIHDNYPRAWCRYGFVDAFNPLTDWY